MRNLFWKLKQNMNFLDRQSIDMESKEMKEYLQRCGCMEGVRRSQDEVQFSES